MSANGNIRAGVAALAAACCMVCAMPVQAQALTESEKLRNLDIILMVTSLRCRMGNDDFQPDFQKFEAHHLTLLNTAAADMRKHLGPQAERALDKISTTIANRYGAGHPWLNCHDLKELTHHLSEVDGLAPLIDAAEQVLSEDPPLGSTLHSAAPLTMAVATVPVQAPQAATAGVAVIAVPAAAQAVAAAPVRVAVAAPTMVAAAPASAAATVAVGGMAPAAGAMVAAAPTN